ncbi:MAG: tetratricopeptide repeat protein [Muribaculaceae bacterium]|nr:tetratricopeptide repeat protein [Muribaculaceae bacterium]MDE7081776.1 tetratricopeptide repeat protein [Muribaculaceae bacterium]
MATNDNNQEQNAIDNINDNLTRATQHVANNKKVIYWCIALIVIFAAGGAAWYWGYLQPSYKNSQNAYFQVETKANGNDSIAAVEYAKVADKYSGSDAGNLAALQAAEAFYRQGKYEQAAKYLKSFSTKDDVMQAQADVLLGDSYVNIKKYDDALSAYDKALRLASGNQQIAPAVLWKKANIYDAQKKYQDALNCYKQIKDSYPTFSFGNGITIDAYIAREEARLAK